MGELLLTVLLAVMQKWNNNTVENQHRFIQMMLDEGRKEQAVSMYQVFKGAGEILENEKIKERNT